jgi:hypothetical protein
MENIEVTIGNMEINVFSFSIQQGGFNLFSEVELEKFVGFSRASGKSSSFVFSLPHHSYPIHPHFNCLQTPSSPTPPNKATILQQLAFHVNSTDWETKC